MNFRTEDLPTMPNKKIKKIAKHLGIESVGEKDRSTLIAEIRAKKKK